MRIPAIALSMLLAGVFAAPPVAAQTPATQPPPAKPQPKPAGPQTRPSPGVGGFLLFDSQSMAAKDTFDAIFEKSTFQSIGFGAEAFNLFRGLFARVTYSKITENRRGTAERDRALRQTSNAKRIADFRPISCMRVPPAPVHGAEDPLNSRPSSSRKAL